MEQEDNGGRVPGGGDDPGEAEELTFDVAAAVGDLPAEEWDALLGEGDEASPFLEHRFLVSLEDAGTLGETNGWIPRIPLVRRAGRLVAAAPAYVKLHSQGEFVFDWSWADFAHRAGISYYPKLVVGVPFTPVTGRRLLTAPGEDRASLMGLLARVMIELCDHMGLSSVHVNFATEEEVRALEREGFLPREGIQYHWFRHEQSSFEDYLGRFNSKRRNQLRRERRELDKQGIEIDVVTGEDLTTSLMDEAFALYKSTIDKIYWGRQYLNRDLFELWRERLPDRLEVVTATPADGRIVAGAVNFRKGRRLYGRYWGCFEELKHLHFNVCYYTGIAECFDRRLDVFEPGAGGQHKLVRGFEPTIMHSAHWIDHEQLRMVIGRHLQGERFEIRRHRAAMLASMGKKRG